MNPNRLNNYEQPELNRDNLRRFGNLAVEDDWSDGISDAFLPPDDADSIIDYETAKIGAEVSQFRAEERQARTKAAAEKLYRKIKVGAVAFGAAVALFIAAKPEAERPAEPTVTSSPVFQIPRPSHEADLPPLPPDEVIPVED